MVSKNKKVAMTPAEKMERYRQKIKNEGGKQIMLKLESDHIAILKSFSELTGIEESKGFSVLFQKDLARIKRILESMAGEDFDDFDNEMRADYFNQAVFSNPMPAIVYLRNRALIAEYKKPMLNSEGDMSDYMTVVHEQMVDEVKDLIEEVVTLRQIVKEQNTEIERLTK